MFVSISGKKKRIKLPTSHKNLCFLVDYDNSVVSICIITSPGIFFQEISFVTDDSWCIFTVLQRGHFHLGILLNTQEEGVNLTLTFRM